MSDNIMTSINVNGNEVNVQEFSERYAELMVTSGPEVAEDFAHKVLGNEPDQEVVETLRPFVEAAMEARKEEIMSKIIGEMNGVSGDSTAEHSENMADRESSTENTESSETLSEATGEEQEGTSTSGQVDRENA